MKLREQLLFRCLAAAALLLGLFGALIIAQSFRLQIERECAAIETRSFDLSHSMEASAVNYALQGIPLTDELLCGMLRQLDDQSGLYAPDAMPILNAASPMPEEGIILRSRTLCSLCPVLLAGETYHLLISSDLTSLYDTRDLLLRGYLFLYLTMMLLFSVFLLTSARRITKPIESLSRISQRLAGGETDVRAPETGSIETIRLARAFNLMTDELTGRIERQNRFIANLTHEMKTPLTSMIGHADLIRSGRISGEDAMLAAHDILREGRRLNDLSARLIDLILLGQEDPLKIRLSVRTLMNDTVSALTPAAQSAGVSLTCSGNGVIEGEPALLRVLLNNLTDNAIKSGASQVQIESFPFGGLVTLTVRDNGRGMDAESLRRITEPFYRVDKSRSRAQGGAGLGLALCAEIARLHDAQLVFQSEPGSGTSVSLALPGKEAEDDAPA